MQDLENEDSGSIGKVDAMTSCGPRTGLNAFANSRFTLHQYFTALLVVITFLCWRLVIFTLWKATWRLSRPTLSTSATVYSLRHLWTLVYYDNASRLPELFNSFINTFLTKLKLFHERLYVLSCGKSKHLVHPVPHRRPHGYQKP